MESIKFVIKPNGPFKLATANQFFGGWATFGPDKAGIAMAFPVEGWRTSAAVILQQNGETVSGEVHHTNGDAKAAWKQALAAVSLDVDASSWQEVGQRDPVIGNLQAKYDFLRPVLFHSPYEAAANFIIGHRITMAQSRAIRQAMARELGDVVSVGDVQLYAFPRPQVLRELSSFKGVSDEKIRRLHGVAQAALDGLLDRSHLRAMPVDEALAALRTLNGIGEFFAQGILHRGAGLVDEITNDDVTKQAIQLAYKLPELVDQRGVLDIAEVWRPYRMWAAVLLHVWLRREMGGPKRQQRPQRSARRVSA